MPSYSDPAAKFPATTPRTLDYNLTHDADADGSFTDRDSANPSNVAGAHLKAAANELIAISAWTDTNKVAGLYARDDQGGVTISYTAGRVMLPTSAVVSVNAGTLVLTDNATNYVECDTAGVVSKNVVGFTAGSFPMATVVTVAGDITVLTDKRTAWQIPGTAAGDMTKAVYDADLDNRVNAIAGGTDIDTSGSTGVPQIVAGTWTVPAAVTLTYGGTGQNFGVTAKGSVIVFNVANTASITTGVIDGHVLTVQGDGTLAFEAVAGAGDMLKATYDTTADGFIDTAAGGTGLNTSASTGFAHIGAGVWSAKKSNLSAIAAPTVNDDSVSGYAIGSEWLDTTADKGYLCLDATATAAVWKETTAALANHTLDSASHTDVAAITEAQGQVFVRGAANWTALDPGTSGYFLQTRGAGADAVWASGAGMVVHNLDSATHGDVATIAEARGMLLEYGPGNKWRGIAPGSQGAALVSQGVGADPTYSNVFAHWGGTNQDSSGWTGVVYVNAGTWTSEAQLSPARGGTGDNTSATTGVPIIDAGNWTYPTQLTAVKGGTGIDTSASTGFGKVAAGTWSVAANTDTLEIGLGNNAAVIAVGTYGPLVVDFACTINQCEMYADVSTTTTVDIWRDSYVNYPALDADSITAAATPTITAATKMQDGTLTGWTTAIAAGDHLLFNVDANNNAKRLTVKLRVTRTA